MREADYYQILGVPYDADTATIERAYRALARRYHPDINPAADAHQRMAAINEAYQVLRDPQRRARYDALRHLRRRLQIVAPLDDAPSLRLATHWRAALQVQQHQWRAAWDEQRERFWQKVEFLFRARGYESLRRREHSTRVDVLFRRRKERVLIRMDFAPVITHKRLATFLDALSAWPRVRQVAYFGWNTFTPRAVREAKAHGVFVYNGETLERVYRQTRARYGRPPREKGPNG